jgi:uncharacterized coiled-coil DUF342 family protein
MNEHDKLAAAIKERDEARAEMHLYKIRADGHYEDYCEILRRIDVVVNERDQAREELQLLKQERDLWQQIQRDKATVNQSLTVRPELSRLEIAAMLLQGLLPMHVNSTDVDAVALRLADRLIAAAKEAK